jgi:hypothetical protein
MRVIFDASAGVCDERCNTYVRTTGGEFSVCRPLLAMHKVLRRDIVQ